MAKELPDWLRYPDATELLACIRAGTLTVQALVEEHLDRLEAEQPRLNAATAIFRDEAIARARELDASLDRNLPLFGLPCSVKESIGIAGQEITAGSLRMKPQLQNKDSSVVKGLRKAGAVIIARSNLPEFSMTGETGNPRYGRTNNPIDVTRGAGGSSGGEGALVGSGSTVFGVGSDILGSIRLPSAFCGVTGFKPASDTVDLTGVWPTLKGETARWYGQGPLTRSVRDAQLVYNVIAKEPIASADRSGRLLEIPDFPQRCLQSNISTAVQAARQVLRDAGYAPAQGQFPEAKKLFLQMPRITLNDFYDEWMRDLESGGYGKFSLSAELLSKLRGKPGIDHGLFMWLVLAGILKPRSENSAEKIAGQYREGRARMQTMLGEDGVLVMPTIGMVSQKHGVFNRRVMRPGLNRSITTLPLPNYCNLPAIAIPAWKYRDEATGLPASVMLMCAPGGEGQLFHAAEIVEAAINP